MSVMVGSGQTGSTLEMNSVHKNKKIGSHPKCLRPLFKDFKRGDDSIYACSRNYFRALREDEFSDLTSLSSHLIILIRFYFFLNKLTSIAKQDFNSMLHKIVSVKEICYK